MNQLKSDILEYLKVNTIDKKRWERNTATNIAKELNVSRNIVSQYLNEFYKQGILGKVNSRPVLYFLLQKNTKEVSFSSIDEAIEWQSLHIQQDFDCVIGNQGSLKGIIQQIKAAVNYPPYGLPILFYGATGTGKSYLAGVVFEYLQNQKIVQASAPFVSVNCSEYADNPELFLANFFGHVKGAYTGADKDKRGLAELANQGVLFLDEIHSLSNECQEKLFQFMDQGKFHRLGDNEKWYTSNCRIIFATSEDPNEHLLTTLLRRIPVKITLPSLERRTIFEKRQLIYSFFVKEKERLEREIELSESVFELLLNASYNGNVGNLKNVIQLICANAYSLNKKDKVLKISMVHLPSFMAINSQEIRHGLKTNQYLALDKLKDTSEDMALMEMIQFLLKSWKEKGVSSELLEAWHHFIKQRSASLWLNMDAKDQHNYIKTRFLQYMKNIEKDYQIKFDYFFFQLITRLLELWLFQGNVAGNKYLTEKDKHQFTDHIFRQFLHEHRLTEQFLQYAELPITPFQESILTLLFKLMINEKFTKKRVALILAHGNLTASSIAKTVNQMVGEFIFDAIDMPLSTTSNEIAIQINQYLREIRNYEELILLVDMGSLETIYNRLENHANKTLGILTNVSTKMALQVAQLLQLDRPIKEILTQTKETQEVECYYQRSKKKRDMILCSCASGLGTSNKLKQILKRSFPKDVDILVDTCDYFSLTNENYLDIVSEEYNILFIVGTLNPYVNDVRFYSIQELIIGKKIDDISIQLKNYFNEEELSIFNKNILKNFSLTNLMEQLTILNPSKLLEQVSDAIYILQNELNLHLDNNICFGLYVHISCLIERLVTQPHLQDEISTGFDQPEERLFLNVFKKAFTVVEQYYSVDIPPDEVKYVYEYIKKA